MRRRIREGWIMKRRAWIFPAALLAGLNGGNAFSDRGSIPFLPGVKIFEPTQRAMIAWNGKEEILLLSTDLRASEPTRVLEVIPLPAEPKVKKGSVEVFRKATALINEKLQRWDGLALGGGGDRRGGVRSKGGEVTFHKKIGAHDVTVTHVLDQDNFIQWVEKYLKSAGVDQPRIPEPLKKVVGEYLRDNFQWFVFDVVSLDREPKTNDAIQYRFQSKCLYYPMRITRTEVGATSVELLVLTPKLFRNFPGIPMRRVELRHDPVSITSKELAGLSGDMDGLLGHRDDMKLRIWRIRGELSSFEKDLIAY